MNEQLQAGDWVEVRAPREIADTLDANGTLDGLPFMPEMVEYCGRRFRVHRRVEKTCVEVTSGRYDFREFPQNDVVLLDGLRCSGADHGGCQRVCSLFWKTAWLRRVSDDRSEAVADENGGRGPWPKLQTLAGSGRYFCQSTELARATRFMPRVRRLLKCYYDVRSGEVSLVGMLWLILVPLWLKMTARLRHPLVGILKRTPVGQLDLQPGDMVEVKSLEEIAQTLDTRGCNRGLRYDRPLSKHSGKRYRVRGRLDRMISEPTGEMRKVEGTVILENATCQCYTAVIGGCPRQDFTYWREIWLKRV